MLRIYKPRAFTGFSKASWMFSTWCLTSVWLCIYLRINVFLNLCTKRLLNLIRSRLWAWLEEIWVLDHKTQSVEPAWSSLGSLGCCTGVLYRCQVELVPPASHGMWRELRPALRAKPVLSGVLTQQTLPGKWHCPGWRSRKALKSRFIPRNNFSFNEGDKWQIN